LEGEIDRKQLSHKSGIVLSYKKDLQETRRSMASIQDLHVDSSVEAGDDMELDPSYSLAGGSETTGTSNAEGPPKRKEEEGIAQQEDKNVFRLRLLVITVLLASTIGVAVTVYLYITNAEQSTFENQFEGDSDKVLGAIGSALDLTLGSVDAFLIALVSYARDTNATWPMVTLPDYAVRVAKLRSLNKAVLVTQYHYVTLEGRTEWENYTLANDAWVQKGIDVQKTDETFHGKIVEEFSVRGEIFDTWNPYNATGPYLPKWQHAPVVPIYDPYNWDGMTFPSLAKSLDVVQSERKIAISDISNIPYPNDPESERQAIGNNFFIKDFLSDDEDETEPFSDMYFPILDYVADFVTVPKASSSDLGKFVGIFAMTFYWRDLIQDILPTDSNGIVIVFKNACSQTFTYQVNGPKTVYLGQGDLHETKYDHLVKASSLNELDAFSIRDRRYTGLSLGEKGCVYTLYVYPSTELEDSHTTNDPIIFTTVAVAIFAFTSLVFVFYDYMGKNFFPNPCCNFSSLAHHCVLLYRTHHSSILSGTSPAKGNEDSCPLECNRILSIPFECPRSSISNRPRRGPTKPQART
jgi:hypothetical protein